MNIVLINPWVTDFAAYDFWMKPLGLLYVGAFLSLRGHNVRLIDCMDRFQDSGGWEIAGKFNKFGTGKFHREIIEKPLCLEHVPRHFNRYGIPLDLFRKLMTDSPRLDVVLVTCSMTYWYDGAFTAVSLVHELLPDVPVLLGGIYARLCTDHALKFSGADAVITESFPSRIIDSVECVTNEHGNGSDIDDHFSSWPDPLWSLYSQLSSAVAMTSRGCAMNCTVCASRQLFDGFERCDPIEAAKSIIRLAERGVKDVAFSDDALLFDTQNYANPMFEELAISGAPVRLHSPNGLHVREITPETAQLMKRAGMVTIRLSL